MKPPRAPDSNSPGSWPKTQDPQLALKRHLEEINKVLTRISIGTSIPDPVNPGRTIISNNEPDRNMDCWKATGFTPNISDTNFTITHNMGRIPTTIIGQDTQNGGLIYRSPDTAWTATTVTLRCTKANSQFIVILG